MKSVFNVVYDGAKGFVTDLGESKTFTDGEHIVAVVPRYGVWKIGDRGKSEVSFVTDDLEEAKRNADSTT